MTEYVLPNIPRVFTAVAELIACIIYILPLKKRFSPRTTLVAFGIGAVVIFFIQFIADQLPFYMWVPTMVVAIVFMYVLIYVCCDASWMDAGYCCARAFIAAELAAALMWQVYTTLTFMEYQFEPTQLNAFVAMVVMYLPVFSIVYFMESKRMPNKRRLGIEPREFWTAAVVASVAFFMSNQGYVFVPPQMDKQLEYGLFFLRTLMDLCGFLILYIQHEHMREARMRHELDAINGVLHRQYEQYQQARESGEILNQKYHDLKHQIEIIQAENDPEKRKAYLMEMNKALDSYGQQYDTGSNVLDTILTSKQRSFAENNVDFTCIADGKLLSFLDVMDVCSLVGNALDNAGESVVHLADSAKRLIKMSLYSQGNFLMLRFENYVEQEIEFLDGLPQTTKPDKAYHGYGIKSMKQVIAKYGGTLTISVENNWFILRMLVPFPDGFGTQTGIRQEK